MFFLDDQLNRRRIDDIRFISSGRAERRGEHDRWVHDVELVDGTSLVLLDVTIAQISKIPSHVAPANPGAFVWAGLDENGADFMLPVVGWTVSVDRNIFSLTAGGSIDDLDTGAVIIFADGRVCQNGMIQHQSLAAYKALIESQR